MVYILIIEVIRLRPQRARAMTGGHFLGGRKRVGSVQVESPCGVLLSEFGGPCLWVEISPITINKWMRLPRKGTVINWIG